LGVEVGEGGDLPEMFRIQTDSKQLVFY